MLKINRLEATKVHEYIPIDITFNENLTFLTGSNGNGKTTALKLISAILQPNFDLLSEIKFETATVSCMVGKSDVKIKLVKYHEHRTIKWEIKSGKAKLKKGEFKLYPIYLEYDYSYEERQSLRESVISEFIGTEFHSIIDSYGNPILLGIDRKILGKLTDYSNENRRIHGFRRSNTKKQSESFLYAQRVVIDYVGSNADSKRDLVENLKSNIYRTLFKYVKHSDLNKGLGKLSDEELLKKRKSTLSAVNKLEIGDIITKEVNDYFDNISNLSIEIDNAKNDGQRNDLLREWWANRPHLKRIEKVSEYAQAYQEKIEELDFPLNEITRICNLFFKESNKSLQISANGRIRLSIDNEEKNTVSLSSGEMQLVVIIIHLVFGEHQNQQSIFVIDEPELSLHISWQEKFVDAILEASPGTQFILATHSPAIVSKLEFEDKCVALKNL